VQLFFDFFIENKLVVTGYYTLKDTVLTNEKLKKSDQIKSRKYHHAYHLIRILLPKYRQT
jgi:hypothetical protein